jgi:hypothetical protein
MLINKIFQWRNPGWFDHDPFAVIFSFWRWPLMHIKYVPVVPRISGNDSGFPPRLSKTALVPLVAASNIQNAQLCKALRTFTQSVKSLTSNGWGIHPTCSDVFITPRKGTVNIIDVENYGELTRMATCRLLSEIPNKYVHTIKTLVDGRNH